MQYTIPDNTSWLFPVPFMGEQLLSDRAVFVQVQIKAKFSYIEYEN